MEQMANKDGKRTASNRKKGTIFNRSLRNQILLPFLVLMTVVVGVVAFVSYESSARNTMEELTNNVDSQMAGMNGTFEIFFQNIHNHIDRFVSSDLLAEYEPKNKPEILEDLAATRDADDAIAFIYTGIEETEEMIDPAGDLEEGYNPTEQGWYKEAVGANGETIWTEPYQDEGTSETVVTAARAFYDKNTNELTGVFALDVSVDILLEMVQEIKIGDAGYAIVLDDSGTYITHPNETLIGEDASVNSFYEEMAAAEEKGIMEYEFEGDDKIMAFAKNPTTGWILAGTVNVAEFEAKARDILVPISIALALSLVLATLISLWITKRITSRIKTVMERMKQIAAGDLSQEPIQVNTVDEVGQLSVATNEMNKNMRELLNQVSNVSETISSHSEELTQAASEVTTGTDQIAITMSELAEGSERQADSASDLTEISETFTSKVDEANVSGEHVKQNSNRILEMTDEGSKLMETSTIKMREINQIVRDSVEKMQTFENHSQEISQLVSVIRSIAEQTNLLALNASIEAARAGESGKGFAVVADEVGKLAEQVAVSVSEITTVVNNIQSESTIIAESLKDGYVEVEQGTEQVISTGQTFQEISTAITEMVENINIATGNLAVITTGSQEMSAYIQEIASVSEESAAGVEQTAASAQEVNGSMEEVAGSSEQLARLAEELNELVGRFRL